MKRVLSFLLLTAIATFLTGQDLSVYQKRTLVSDDGDSLLYRIMYPVDYDTSRSYPLVIFLHGAGERGADNELQLKHGAKLFADAANRRQYPAIVVFPQCPQRDSWMNFNRIRRGEGNGWRFGFTFSPSDPLEGVIGLIDRLLAEESIDLDRLYLAGLSMGGFGTFDLLARYPDRFAAAIPICGGGNREMTRLYAPYTALWIFHGAKDTIVPVDNSRQIVEALKRHDANVRYTEYPEADHNSWDPAFAEPDFLQWLFAQTRK